MDDSIIKLVCMLDKSSENILEKINNTSYDDILRLRNEAAEQGIEMTPNEVIDLIKLLKIAGS